MLVEIRESQKLIQRFLGGFGKKKTFAFEFFGT